MNYPHLAARIFNTPLLIQPNKLDAIIAGLGPRLFGADSETAALVAAFARASAPAAEHAPLQPALFSTRSGATTERGYQVIDGVAVLPISGALVHRSRFVMADCSMLQGYNDLTADVEDAMSNPDVHAILRVYDTPGGEVQGAFEHAQRLADLRGKKPMFAIADGMAASAGYLSAVNADQFAVTTTGYAGSIGVVMRHIDLSAALASDGVKVTHIFAGAHKIDGNPFEPLPEAVRADFQAEIDSLYAMFIAAVAAARTIDAEAIRKTQAQTYRGQAAVDAGLADRLSTTDQLITELAGLRARSYPVGPSARTSAIANSKENSMNGTETPTGQTPAPVTFTQADLDRARAEGQQAGASAERDRISGILAHDAAAAHPDLARQCINTGLTAEQASAIMGAAPKPILLEAKTGQVNAFAVAMAALPNPDVSGIEAGAAADNPEAEAAASILAAFKQTC